MNICHYAEQKKLILIGFKVIICALNESTYHLINERTLSLMKKTAILVNTSRGPTVDLNALYRALKEGQLGKEGLSGNSGFLAEFEDLMRPSRTFSLILIPPLFPSL